MEQGNIISIIFGSVGILTFALSYFQTAKRDERTISKEEFSNTAVIMENIKMIKDQLDDLSVKITNIEDKITKNSIDSAKVLTTFEQQIKAIFKRLEIVEKRLDKLEGR